MGQVARMVTAAEDGVLIGHRVLIGDRDASARFRFIMERADEAEELDV